MRGDNARGKNGSDERKAIGRARDVTISETRTRECGCRVEQARRTVFRNAQRRTICVHAEWLDVFAFQHREASSLVVKMRSIVGCIQLSAKPDIPTVCRIEPWNVVHDT